jgi:hypothetical protein
MSNVQRLATKKYLQLQNKNHRLFSEGRDFKVLLSGKVLGEVLCYAIISASHGEI